MQSPPRCSSSAGSTGAWSRSPSSTSSPGSSARSSARRTRPAGSSTASWGSPRSMPSARCSRSAGPRTRAGRPPLSAKSTQTGDSNMRTIRSISTFTAVAAASAVAVAGPASAGPQGSAASAGAKKDIVETAVDAGKFDTLASLLKKAGLVKTLKGNGPYTVFAPTDTAFAKVPQATLEKLGRKPKQLRRVLKYHVVARDLKAADIVERRSVRTLAGAKIKIRVRGANVHLNRSAKVVEADIAASNGTIHVIDRVLLPPRRR